MEYKYFNRGKCIFCNQLIWNTTPGTGVVCRCSSASIIGNDFVNVVDPTDSEFILAVQAETFTTDDIQLIKIT